MNIVDYCHNMHIFCHYYRSRSGVLGPDSSNYPPWLIYRREQRLIRCSASNSGAFTAAHGLVTYLQLCRPIVPQARTVHSGNRTYKPYRFELGDAISCPRDDSALVVHGVPVRQSVSCEKNQASERVHIHVYLPNQGGESTRSQSEEEEACSKFTNLSLQEG